MAAAAVAMMTACASVERVAQPDLTPQSGYEVGATEAQNKGRTFEGRNHVVIKNRAGTFKPRDTHYSLEVSAEPGRTGIVRGGLKLASDNAPREALLVRLDEQVWRDTSSSNAEVTLKPFEATIHADYLEVVR